MSRYTIDLDAQHVAVYGWDDYDAGIFFQICDPTEDDPFDVIKVNVTSPSSQEILCAMQEHNVPNAEQRLLEDVLKKLIHVYDPFGGGTQTGELEDGTIVIQMLPGQLGVLTALSQGFEPKFDGGRLQVAERALLALKDFRAVRDLFERHLGTDWAELKDEEDRQANLDSMTIPGGHLLGVYTVMGTKYYLITYVGHETSLILAEDY